MIINRGVSFSSEHFSISSSPSNPGIRISRRTISGCSSRISRYPSSPSVAEPTISRFNLSHSPNRLMRLQMIGSSSMITTFRQLIYDDPFLRNSPYAAQTNGRNAASAIIYEINPILLSSDESISVQGEHRRQGVPKRMPTVSGTP